MCALQIYYDQTINKSIRIKNTIAWRRSNRTIGILIIIKLEILRWEVNKPPTEIDKDGVLVGREVLEQLGVVVRWHGVDEVALVAVEHVLLHQEAPHVGAKISWHA